MSQSRRPALGRGLSALIPGAGAQRPDEQRTGVRTVPLAHIRPARNQPRTAFDDERIASLAASIEADGLLQPIVVRQVGHDAYAIIAGERRFRASTHIGLESVPVVVRDVTDSEAYELALIENLQREDLGPLEEAEAYRYLADQHQMTQEQIAKRVGRDRTTISNALRLLKLIEPVRELIEAGVLTAGHGRALLTAPTEHQEALAQLAVAEGWSVRETERRARAIRDDIKSVKTGGAQAEEQMPAASTRAVETQLRAALGAPIKLVNRKGKGRIEIRFHSLDELDRLIELIARLDGV